MDKLESKIVEILKRGSPLRAKEIAAMLGVERREVNHYLYSSLKDRVIQDTDYKWSLKLNQTGNNQYRPLHPPQTPTPQPQVPRLVTQENSYKIIRRQLEKVSSEEKVKILENAFRQERFIELEDEQINALSSILDEAKREVSIANQAYTKGKLSSQKNNHLLIAVVSIALVLGGLLFINYLQSNSIDKPNLAIPESR